MAKKNKVTNKDKGKLGRSIWRSRFFYLTVLLILVVVLLFWGWPAIASWFGDVASQAVNLLGWGLALIGLIVVVVLGAIWRHRLLALARRWKLNLWHQWLGAVAFLFAVWGILALLNQGGSFGQSIIGTPGALGILRVLGLILVGTILVFPGAFFRFIVAAVSWLRQRFKRRPIPPPVVPERPAVTPVAQVPRAAAAEQAPVVTAPSPGPAPQELRQVAREVWRKYGESPELVTVDGWRLPPIDILDKSPEVEIGEADNLQRAKLIEEALASYGVEAKVVQINAGPTVTQFGVEPGWARKTREIRERDRNGNINVRMEEVSKTRVKVDRITALANDLALALAASSIRIEAPVPGKSVVGIEVPNTVSSMVSLRGVIETNSFQKVAARSRLTLALGKGAGGEAIASDLAKMPHLLIAGATGSGKTVCLNAIICCLLLHNTPHDIRLIMVDPKRVELTPYNGIPHLAVPVIVNTDKALSALRWLNQEMDRRYQKMAAVTARNIEAYNRSKEGQNKMPYLVLVIDELADLMMTGFDEVEHILCRLAQLARATGIHLIVATQRPSVDVVTGLIKANFPTRLSFAVTSQVDSRTILDIGGAEKLLGRGDMLFMPTEAAKPKRLQGCFVSDPETERLVYFWGSQKEEVPSLKVEEVAIPVATAKQAASPEDPLLDAAHQLAKDHKHISTSFLQRKLHIGYPRAARIMEQLEESVDQGEAEGEAA